MKNLFVITEEEKNRILGLHKSATKSQYLISEQVSTEKQIAGQIYSASYGVGTDEESFVQAIEKINSLEQLIAVDNLLKRGYSRLGLEGQINDEFNPSNFDDRTYLNRIETKINSLGAQLTYKPMVNNSVKIQFEVQSKTENSVGSKQGITWDIAVKRWPCFEQIKDKKIYNNGSYDYVIYPIDGLDYYVFIGDGHVYNPFTKQFTSTYLGKDYPCGPIETMPEVDGNKGKNTQTKSNPNVERIKDLQRKVGVKDDGILGKQTLKAIMDKLTK